MFRMSWAVVCGALLAGCATVPLEPTAPLPAPDQVRLFQRNLPADPDAIQREVIAHVGPGTPLAEGKAVLSANGFECQPYSATAIWSPIVPPEIATEYTHAELWRQRCPGGRSMYCSTRTDVHGRWGQESATVLVFPRADVT
jgi:hypothetical protein